MMLQLSAADQPDCSVPYAGLREMKTKIIDGRETRRQGSFVSSKMIWDIGGTEPIAAGQLIGICRSGLTFEPDVVLNTIVTNIQKDNDDYFTITTSTGENIIQV